MAFASLLDRLRSRMAARSAAAVPAMPGPVAGRAEARIVLVCLRCAQKVAGGIADDGRTSLRAWLRARLAADGRPKALRVVETSCLGLCPKDAVTVALPRDLAGTMPSFYTLTHPEEREALYTHVLRPAIGASTR